MKRQEFKGEITAFLSIVFVLLMSLVGALIQSASIQVSRSRRRTETRLALESYFAEFHDQAWEDYSILVREGTNERQVAKRLDFYGASLGTHEIQKMQLLSDGCGQAFYEQAIRFMGGTVKDEETPGDGGAGDGVGPEVSPDKPVDQEEKENEKELENLLKEEEKDLPEKDNPLGTVENLKKSSLLSLVHPSPETLSMNTIDLGEAASHRTLQEGNFTTSASGKGGVTEKALFLAYLSLYFEEYSGKEQKADEDIAKENTQEGLNYELEYLINGAGSDQGNLESIAKKILGVRMAINYAHILSDSTKKAEADAMALTLTALFTVPAAKDIVKHALLLAWAYGESVVDLRVLFKGKKVPLVKTRENWQLQLANLSKLGTSEESVTEGDGSKGMSYEDYLKGFLAVADSDQLCMRALDIMEVKLGIRVDQCVTALEIQSSGLLLRGIQDKFVTKYEYE